MIKAETLEVFESESGNKKEIAFNSYAEIDTEGIELIGELTAIFDELRTQGYSYDDINNLLMDSLKSWK